ncbi:uncharacterized protein BCR38DRAFT_345013 [Pseudomassariella vexata]|uniref:Ysc84 actin-binding domain-containing protein n=1 Tax=Pseudomassariella vexata TaxID=1141098 RepID=A0A1Y2DV58_9PEZI|nr:uncharacterized protein BCR38DRAFT_345013 [Pseudomassariella vexata]ORY63153.1 hypothetical protein BCR38DRAFT_345013 [Pseudomassariella vexata]
MQRVSALLPSWDRSRNSAGSGSTNGNKTSLDKVRGWADKIPSPTNRLSTSRLTKEAFWPTTLDKECEKAARILKSFCSDGFLVPDERPTSPLTTSSGGTSTSRVLKKIPPRIMQNAVGLAVFTSMRSGLWTSGSGGSGILLARKADGTWSPPSGLMLQTATLGFVLGVDIYDCVVIINTFTMLETFGRSKFTLGTDVSLAAGPLVSLGLLENDIRWADLSDTVFTYVKAKGQSANVRLDGTILSHRPDENERFYGANFSIPKILAGDVNQSLPQLRSLSEILKAAEGRTDYDAVLVEQLASTPCPSDASIESPSSVSSLSPSFGIPDIEDPDPFGVLALEMAGLEIREAGTRLRPESSQFEYAPSPTSIAFPRAGRQSVDTYLSRSNRGSYMSSKTMATERSQMTDACTQTELNTPETTPSPSYSENGQPRRISEEVPKFEEEPEEVDYTKIDLSALRNLSAFPDLEEEPITASPEKHVSNGEAEAHTSAEAEKPDIHVTNDDGVDADDEEMGDSDSEDEFEDAEQQEEEEPVVYEVATAQAPPRMTIVAAQAIQMKGAVVTIPRRIPPPLPLRSPARMSRASKSEFGDVSMMASPLRQEFETGVQIEEAATPKPGETFIASTNGAASPLSTAGDAEPATSSTEVERSATPTQETINPLSDSHDQARAAVTATQPAFIEAEKVEPESNHGVPVSVA